MPNASSILVVIPALNEAGAIAGVLGRLAEQGLRRVRVVDNGSTDGTDGTALRAGAEVVHEPSRGYGRACWTGLQNLPDGVEWILFCDADGSDALEDLPRLLRAADEGAVFVCGDRTSTVEGRAVMTPVQRFGNALATFLIRLAWGASFRDLGPLRLVRRDALERIAMEDRGFGWTIEMQIRAAELGLRWAEVPVGYHRRRAGKSKISGNLRGMVGAGSVILGTWGKFVLRKRTVQRALAWGSTLLLLAGAAAVASSGDFARYGVRPLFWAGALALVLGYVISWAWRDVGRRGFLFLSLGLRVVMWFMFPGDDVWRYLWEGRVQNAGFNPYVLAPADPALAELRDDAWALMPHREITAIYPPLTQALMRVAALGAGWWWLKLMVAAADFGVAVVLARRFGPARATLYAWCPLVLLAFAGGGHFDAWMLLAMVVGWLAWDSGRIRLAVLALGAACGIKYVAAPLLAWVLWRQWRDQGTRRVLELAVWAMLPTLLAVILLPPPWDPRLWFPKDFAVYARSADFLPRIFSWIWEPSLRMNQIHLIPAALLGMWVVWRSPTLAVAAERWFIGLLVLSPLVHAWYFTWGIPFAVASGSLGWRLAGVSALIYFQLQQLAFVQKEWLLGVPLWLLLWGPPLLGWLWDQRRKER
ncbi:MAG: glycosyltransferase family 2 protein [Candidatus Methylacidiphilales bacterium]|nr:glycosyltransferase family 2 protein [Candidatus Methylacidiphilales bacterium]